MIALCAWGFDALLVVLHGKRVALTVQGVSFAVLMLLPFVWMVRNHPNECVYFNEAFGGTKAAVGEYETDYWMNSTKEMANWFKRTHKAELDAATKAGKEIVIATDCIDQFEYEIKRQYPCVRVSYMRYHNRQEKPWQYAFFVARYIDPGFLKNGWFPNDKAIYTAKADGAAIGVVLERKEGYDFEGEKAFKAQNIAAADSLWHLEIAKYPHEEGVYDNLANLYLQTNRPDAAKPLIDKVLAAAPTFVDALLLEGQYYMTKQDWNRAETTYGRIIELNDRMSNAYYYIGLAKAQKGDLDGALEVLNKCIDGAPNFTQAYQLAASILDRKGDHAAAQRYMQAARQQ